MGTGRVFKVKIVGLIHGLDRDGLDEHLDLVMEELLRLEVRDPSIDVDFATTEVRIGVEVAADNPLAATNEVSAAIRAAIHSAGGGTPDWPTVGDEAWRVELTGIEAGHMVNADS